MGILRNTNAELHNDDLVDVQGDLVAKGQESSARFDAIVRLRDDYEDLSEQLEDALGREERLKECLRCANLLSLASMLSVRKLPSPSILLLSLAVSLGSAFGPRTTSLFFRFRVGF